MRKLILVTLLSCLLGINCSKRLNNANEVNRIEISLEVEGVNLPSDCNEYSLRFIERGIEIAGLLDGCYLQIPDFTRDTNTVTVIFQYQEYNFEFQNLEVTWFEAGANWNFKIDYPPFDEMNNKELKGRNPIEIHYLQFLPQKGQAIEIINPVYKK